MKAKPSTRRPQTRRELHDLQRLMAAAVTRPLTPRDTMQSRWSDGRATKRIAESFIKPNDRLTSFEKLEIYNRQYWFRVRDSFNEDFPGLRAVLGDKNFERLADTYIERQPSQSFTLRNLGARLVKFLETNPRWTASHKRLALDMARLEWAHIEAFDGEAKPPFTTDDLLDSNPAKLRLKLQPHLTLLKLAYDVDDLLIALKENSGLRSEASNAMEQNPKRAKTKLIRGAKRQTVFLAVHRHNDRVFYKRLEPGQFRLLTELEAGATLEKACAKLVGLKISGDLSATLQQWFAAWSALGWFCRPEKIRKTK